MAARAKPNAATEPGDRVLVVTRVFDAWTECLDRLVDHLARLWIGSES